MKVQPWLIQGGLVVAVVLGAIGCPHYRKSTGNARLRSEVAPDVQARIRNHVLGNRAEFTWDYWTDGYTDGRSDFIIPANFSVRPDSGHRPILGKVYAHFDFMGRLSKTEIYFIGIRRDNTASISSDIDRKSLPHLGFLPSFSQSLRSSTGFDNNGKIDGTDMQIQSGGGGGFLLLTYGRGI